MVGRDVFYTLFDEPEIQATAAATTKTTTTSLVRRLGTRHLEFWSTSLGKRRTPLDYQRPSSLFDRNQCGHYTHNLGAGWTYRKVDRMGGLWNRHEWINRSLG
jgi:hypothetical protein